MAQKRREYSESKGYELIVIELDENEWIAFIYCPTGAKFETHRIANNASLSVAQLAAHRWIDQQENARNSPRK